MEITCYDKYGRVIEKIVQWDVGQSISIKGYDLTSYAPQIHFANANSEKALVVESVFSGGLLSCQVPNSLARENLPIIMYIYDAVGETGKTNTIIKIPVTPRPMPDDVVYTDDVGVISLTEVLRQAREYMNNSLNYSTKAKESEEKAKTSADAAKVSETNAAKSESTAFSSAAQAAQSAKEAKAYVGSPLVANTVSTMTDQTKVYVYTGSESGYTAGNWYYHNGSAWVSGGVYNSSAVNVDKTLTQDGYAADAKVTGDAVNSLREDIDNVAFIGFQYLNSADGERNKYYSSYGNKKSISDSNYVAFPIISLPAGKYYLQNLSDVFTYFDDGTSIKNFSGYNAENKTLDLDISRIISITGIGDENAQMTISNVKVSDNKYGVVYVKIIGDNTSERIQTAENNIKSLNKKVESIINAKPSEKRHIITVGNEKDFVSIKEAVASITDSSKNNIYDIYIDDGVYEEYAITLPDYVNLIGASGNREKCVIKGELPDSASANEITVNSTLNLKDSNVLENLTITAKNLRYPIHSESGGTHINWVQILNNCYVEHLGNTSPNNTWTSYHAWGEGSSSGAYAEFNNCIFKSPAEPWYVHEFANLPDIPRPYHHILNNCQIINTMISDTGIWLSTAKIDNTKNSDIINTIDFNNCVFYNGEISINDVCSININIHGGNNVAIRVANEYPNTDYTNIKTYVGTEPVKKGTVLKYSNGINLVEKANESTPAEMIAGVAVEDCESNTLVKIIKGTYVVASYRIGTSVYCDNDGQITSKGTYAIGISYGEFCLIF